MSLEGIVKEEPYSSADEFLGALRPENPRWVESSRWIHKPKWIYRGHGDSDWQLRPSSWRDGETGSPLRSFLLFRRKWAEASKEVQEELDRIEGNRERFLTVFVQRCAEHDAVWRFRQVLDDIGFELPEYEPGNTEETLLANGIPWVGSPWHTASPLHAVAQHHGIPTRLLDWTKSSEIAAFFAAEDAAKCRTGSLAVWALRTGWLNPLGGDIGFLSVPSNVSPHIVAQRGVFTYVYQGQNWFLENGSWPTLDSVVSDHATSELLRTHGPALVKFSLPTSEASALLETLGHRGISRARLMPSHDSAAKTVLDQTDREAVEEDDLA